MFYIKRINFTACMGQTSVILDSRECHKYNFSSVIHFWRSWSSKWKNKTHESHTKESNIFIWYVSYSWQCVHIYVNYQPSSWLSWINSGPMESWKSPLLILYTNNAKLLACGAHKKALEESTVHWIPCLFYTVQMCVRLGYISLYVVSLQVGRTGSIRVQCNPESHHYSLYIQILQSCWPVGPARRV